MNKKELIVHVQRSMGPGATRRAASAAVEAVLSSITALVQQEPLHITGFGTFSRRHHAATRGHDIPSGTVKERTAYSTLSFKPAQGLYPGRLNDPRTSR